MNASARLIAMVEAGRRLDVATTCCNGDCTKGCACPMSAATPPGWSDAHAPAAPREVVLHEAPAGYAMTRHRVRPARRASRFFCDLVRFLRSPRCRL